MLASCCVLSTRDCFKGKTCLCVLAGAQHISSMHRSSGWASATTSRHSSMPRTNGHSSGAHGRGSMVPQAGAILEDEAPSIYHDIDIPAPTSHVDGPQSRVCFPPSCLPASSVPIPFLVFVSFSPVQFVFANLHPGKSKTQHITAEATRQAT
jgi:hypothetical protein